MKKTFVLDTNVILNDFTLPFVLAKTHNVVIPLCVLEELDHFKKKEGGVGYNSRRFSGEFKNHLKKVKIVDGNIELGGHINLVVDRGLDLEDRLSSEYDESKPDFKILATAIKHSKIDENTVLLTNDTNLMVHAVLNGIVSENSNQHKANHNYTGIAHVDNLTDQEISDFYSNEPLYFNDKERFPTFYPNQFIIIKRDKKTIGFTKFVGEGEPVEKLPHKISKEIFKVKPRSKEQGWVGHLGMQLRPGSTNEIDLLTLEGPAGSGKTLYALAIALELVETQKMFSSITLTKPVAALGTQDVGFLKGSYQEKIMPFMQSYVDILDKLGYSSMEHYCWDESSKFNSKRSIIQFETLTYMRGRNLSEIVIVDEAQNFSKHELKSLVTRMDEGAKVILIADTDQIDISYLDRYNNGFSYIVEKLKAEKITGHISLKKSERSRLAAVSGKLL